MKTKLLLLIAICIAALLNAHAQKDNPFSSIGKVGIIKNAYGNRFVETFDYDSIQRIGTVLINIHTKKIVAFLDPKKVFAKYSDNSASSRWLSIDPKAEKYINMSPYTGMGNNPILFADIDGAELIVCGDPKLQDAYARMLTQTSGRTVTINHESGLLSVGAATGAKGSSQVLASLVSDVAGSSNSWKISLSSGGGKEDKTWIDSYVTGNVDVSDLKTIRNGAGNELLAGVLGHFLAEVSSNTGYSGMNESERTDAFATAHAAGLAKDGEIVGEMLGIARVPRTDAPPKEAPQYGDMERITTYSYGNGAKNYQMGIGIKKVTREEHTITSQDGQTISIPNITIKYNFQVTTARDAARPNRL